MTNFEYMIGGISYRVAIKELGVREAVVEVNGTDYRVEIASAGLAALRPGAVQPATPAAPAGAPAMVRKQIPEQTPAGAGREIQSPLPGLVVEVRVKPGDRFVIGNVLVVIEAMKMKNNIVAAHEGIVKEVRVKPHDEVKEGDVLIVFGD